MLLSASPHRQPISAEFDAELGWFDVHAGRIWAATVLRRCRPLWQAAGCVGHAGYFFTRL